MELTHSNDGYELIVQTPRTNSCCWDRSWVAEITPDGNREWVRKFGNTADTSDGGTVTYAPLREGGEYLYGQVFMGESNYSYNKHGGEAGAFTIRDGALVEIDADVLKQRERECKVRSHNAAVAAANDFAQQHNLPSLLGDRDGKAAIARQQLVQQVPAVAMYPITSAEWWGRQAQSVGLGKGTAFGGVIAQVVLASLCEAAAKQVAVEDGLREAQSHPLCREYPSRVTSVAGGQIRIVTKYGEDFANVLRRLGAKWNHAIGRWELPIANEDGLRKALDKAAKTVNQEPLPEDADHA
jgi:hypothetical protein